MKKLISFILVVIIMASGLSASVYSAENSMVGLADVLNLYPDSEENVFVTRGEFLSLVMKALKIDYSGHSDTPIFADITTGHKYYGEIVFAAKAGIISGASDGKFYPDDYITFEHASIMMIRAMNYDEIVENNDYYTFANKLDLFKGVTQSSTYVLRHEVQRILINILLAPYPRYSYILDGVVQEDSTETFLKHVWGLYVEDGIVDSTDIRSLSGTMAREKCVTVDGVMYSSSVTSMEQYFGMKVRIFYAVEDETRIIHYAYAFDDNIVAGYEGRMFSSFNGSQIILHDENGGKDTYKTNSKTALIWNNKNMKTKDFINKLNNNPGEITLIDNDGNNVVDVVYVLEYKVYGKGFVDTYNSVIVDEKYPDLELDKYSNYVIKNTDGEELTVNDLKSDWHYLVYDPEDYNFPLLITAVDMYLEGEVAEIDSGNGYVKLKIGDEYRVSNSDKVTIGDLKLGFQYIFYFDNHWNIIDAEETKRDGAEAVYFIEAKQDYFGNVDARVLLETNVIEKVQFAPKVIFRGENGTESTINAAQAFEKMKYSGVFKPQFAFVLFNDSDQITKIIQPCTDTTKAYHIQDFTKLTTSATGKRRWMKAQNSFENQIQLKGSTKVFVVPHYSLETQEDEYYRVTSTSIFTDDTTYTINEYEGSVEDRYIPTPVIVKVGDLAADYLVLECPAETSFSTSGGTAYGLITKISDYYDAETSSEMKKITLLNSGTGKEESYIVKCDSDAIYDRDGCKIDVGDIVRIIKTGASVKSEDILVFYDRDTDEYKFVTSYDYGVGGSNEIGYRFYANFRVTEGEVEGIVDNIVKCINMKDKRETKIVEYIDYSGCKIIKFNSSKKGYEELSNSYLKKGDKYVAMMGEGRFKYVIFYE